MKRAYLAVALLGLAPACKKESQGGVENQAGGVVAAARGTGGNVGGKGTLVAEGKQQDLRLTPDDRTALYLQDAVKPAKEGVPEQMLVGDLYAAPLSGGGARKLGSKVTNLLGGFLVSPDSKWVAFLENFDVGTQTGELFKANLEDPQSPPVALAKNAKYYVMSPDSKWMAFVADGVLKVGPIDAAEFPQVAGEVSTASFSSDSKYLLFRRRMQAAGGLLALELGKNEPPKKIAEQVADYSFSPDAKRVAYSQRSPEFVDTYDLFLASAPDFKAQKVAVGTSEFVFSPDSRWLARTEGVKPGQKGDLYVGPATGETPKKVGEKVSQVAFSPDSKAVAYLELYDDDARAGVLGVATLPAAVGKRIGNRVPNYSWGTDGTKIAFLSRFLKPVYSVDLMVHRLGDEGKGLKVAQGVFGYGFAKNNELLVFRTGCVRNGRECDLFALDMTKPPAKIEDAGAGAELSGAERIAKGVFSFKPSDDGGELMLTYARLDMDAYDVGILDLAAKTVTMVDQGISLPAHFAAKDGSKIAYVVKGSFKPGLYTAPSTGTQGGK